MWLVVISKSDSISIIHNWKWMSNPANIVLKWVWNVIRPMLYIRWIVDADNTEWLTEWTNIVNCNGYMCDWMNDAKSVQWFSFLNISQNRWATNLFQEDQSFNHLLLVSITIESETDWLTYCVNQRINQPIHEWINDAHFMQWITIIRLS